MKKPEYRIDWQAVVLRLDGTNKAISERTGVSIQVISRLRTCRTTTPNYPDGHYIMQDYGQRDIPLRC